MTVTKRYAELRAKHRLDFERQFPQLLEQTHWPEERLRDEREARLRELLRVAKERSSWHADRLAAVSPASFQLDDLSRLPTMSKRDLMENFDAIACDPRVTLAGANKHVAGLVEGSYLFDCYQVIASGGSSGLRGVFVYDWDAWIHLGAIAMRWGVREAQARGMPPLERPVAATVFANKASHISYALGAVFSGENQQPHRFPINMALTDIVSGLNRVQPDTLGAYPSALQMLIEEAQAGRLDIHPYHILTCGEPLYPEIEASAEKVFGVAVHDLWGMSEGAYAGSCGQGQGMHLPDDLTWIEPVDAESRPVPAGTRAAKFLFTNLYNHALPLIRYEVSDEIMLLDGPCSCGSGHRRMAGVLGRQDDLFRYDKVTIHPQVFRSPLGREANVIEYRVTQTRNGAQIALCARGPVDPERLGRIVREGLADAGLAAPEVGVHLVTALDRQATGKLKRFVPLPEG